MASQRIIVLSAGLGLAVLACGQSAQKPIEFTGRLVEQVSLLLSDENETAAEIPQATGDSLLAKGFEIDEAQHMLIAPPTGMSGYWVKLEGDEDWYATNKHGDFAIVTNKPPTAKVSIYREILDDIPEATATLADLQVPQSAGLPGRVFKFVLPLPSDMNAEHSMTPGLSLHALTFPASGDGCAPHCAATDETVVHNTEGCCQDYDGPGGDGKGRFPEQTMPKCTLQVLRSFIGSTCFQWSVEAQRGFACKNEGAYCKLAALTMIGKDESYLALLACLADSSCRAKYDDARAKCTATRPRCYTNHKYRNCQNLSIDDFSISPSAVSVKPGASVTIHLRNNTVGNRTVIEGLAAGDGNITAAVSSTSKASLRFVRVKAKWVIDHYSDATLAHYEDIDITYTAPPPKQGSKCTPERILNLLVGPGTGDDVPSTGSPDTHAKMLVISVTSAGTCADKPWHQLELLSDGLQAADNFGYSVAISGNTAIVGTRHNQLEQKVSDNTTGAAYVFVRQGTTWKKEATLEGDSTATPKFGNSVSISGNVAVVGDSSGGGIDNNGLDTSKWGRGVAYVFVREGTSWTRAARLEASDASTNGLGSMFGYSVSISGKTVVVGAPQFGGNLGKVYVFGSTDSIWSEQGQLEADDGAADDFFGFAIAVSGDTVIVGTPYKKVGANNYQGQAYVFVGSGSTWSTVPKKLDAAGGLAGDNFAQSVAIADGTAIVGASSSSRVFTRNAGEWTEHQLLSPIVAQSPDVSDRFGHSVAISGNMAAVGSWFFNTDASKAKRGAVSLFVNRNGVWSEAEPQVLAAGVTPGDAFGGSVAISDGTVVAGAAGRDLDAKVNLGAAYIFQMLGSD